MDLVKLPEKQFLQSLVSHVSPQKKNRAAEAVFDSIQAAFDAFTTDHRDLRWMTDPDMTGMLAACACTLLEYRREDHPEQEINWESRDFILARTLRGFMTTLVIAIRRDGTRELEGGTYFRSFHIPDWFVAWAKDDRNIDYEDERFYPTRDAYEQAVQIQYKQ